MITRRRTISIHALLVMVGTFAAPIAQWIVFFSVARSVGSSEAGTFALILSIATPLVTVANWGLRNGYITLRHRSAFADFVILRLIGIVLASAVLTIIGLRIQVDPGMVVAVVIMKAADSVTDIWFGRWQQQQRILPFACIMIVNSVVTIICSTLFAFLALPGAWIVSGSAVGSAIALFGTLMIDRAEIGRWISRGRLVPRAYVGSLWRIMVNCWQICAGQLLAVLVVNAPIWAVGIFGTPTELGRFAAAAYLITAGSLLGSSLNSVFIGRYHADMVSGGVSSVQRSVRRGNVAVSSLGVLAVVIVGLLGVWAFRLMYGQKFDFTTTELVLVALAAALNPGTFLMNAALLAVNFYAAQLAIVAGALLGAIAAAAIAASAGLSGFLIGAICALAGSVLKYSLSYVWLRRVTAAAAAL